MFEIKASVGKVNVVCLGERLGSGSEIVLIGAMNASRHILRCIGVLKHLSLLHNVNRGIRLASSSCTHVPKEMV